MIEDTLKLQRKDVARIKNLVHPVAVKIPPVNHRSNNAVSYSSYRFSIYSTVFIFFDDYIIITPRLITILGRSIFVSSYH